MAAFNIVGLCGSLRHGSFNMAALRAAADLVPEGVAIDIAGIGDIPLYNDDVRVIGMPDPVLALAGRIAAADAVLIATPEYNYSIPGVLKNTIDWLSRCEPQPFRGKPVAIMGASPGMIGTARAQYDLRKVFVFLDAHVLNKPEIMIGGAAQKFDGAGMLTDATTRQFIGQQVAALRDWGVRLRP
ncbi:NAD(P)H-dependent oxidoreductase [Acidiphilium sp. PA]|nr:NADPH-dependent FMN reductase [Acidiphilium sp. PA]MCW8305431.1 NAD(P)H-dependent oxidoreductase [Acidiphilium sp. PA]